MFRDWYGEAKRGFAERQELRKYKPKKRKKTQVEKATYTSDYYGVSPKSKRQQQREVDEAVRRWKAEERRRERAELAELRKEERAKARRSKVRKRKAKRTVRKVWRRLI